MYNTSNPAELYPNTMWELLPDNKFLKTGSTPLQQGGSNSIKITKANLPAEKLQIESHFHTQPTHVHSISTFVFQNSNKYVTSWDAGTKYVNPGNTNAAGGENTGNSAPYTSVMGSGTPITINPEHITVKAWKRLS